MPLSPIQRIETLAKIRRIEAQIAGLKKRNDDLLSVLIANRDSWPPEDVPRIEKFLRDNGYYPPEDIAGGAR